jgi:thioesterase domain-containing protein/acyl carrier protein
VASSEDGSGGKRLVAYFVDKGSQPQGSELRHFLQNKLPEYMIPSIFVSLEALPMTPTGKIDRLALPQPDIESHAQTVQHISPRNQTEEELVKIWKELLQVPSIGVKDNFFELGGHSLLAVRMFTRINQTFNVNLPLATLFREATIEYLAQVINDQSKSHTWSSLIAIEPEGSHPPFFCVHGLTGDILWFRNLAGCLAPDYPFYGLQSRGLDGIQDPLLRIEDMAKHYIEEIRLLQPTGPYYLGGASFGGTIALEMAQQLLAQGQEVALLAIFDHAPPNLNVDDGNSKLKRRLIIAYRIMRNFPQWLMEFIQMGPSKMWLRIRRKLRLIQKVKNQTGINKLGTFDAEDLIDFASELSAHRQQLITRNYQALKMYVPQPYAGKVTLFRALKRPLLNTYDPEAGWQKLAPGRVAIFDIPSSHEGMFQKPQVSHLAEKLKNCLG